MKSFCFASLLLLAASTALAQAPAPASDKPAPPPAAKSFDAASIDATADPCTDFYQFACGNWVKNNPIPADQVRWGSFNLLAERNRYLLWEELEAAAKNPTTPLEKQYGSYYAACMNADLVEKKGLAPLKDELAKIAALNDPKKLGELMGELDAIGAGGPLFNFGVSQDDKDSS